MLTYITETEYKELSGTDSIPDNFNQLNIEASTLINYKTQGRINQNNIPEQVKYATCLVINLVNEKKAKISEIGNLKSQNIEGWSETYTTPDEIEKDFNTEVDELLEQYLFGLVSENGLPYLYKGVPVYE